MQKNPLLSISIMVSNRIDTIRKCMESIKPLLTEIPCELIALDTVGESTDGSIDVVREYTDKVYRFKWCNDFAKARNYGLEKCSGEWFMFMDDDEWFEDVTEIVDFFRNGEYKKYNCANYKIRSYINREGAYSAAALFRMVKREKDTRFVGRVHEHIQPLLVPIKEFSAFVHHYGYAFETDEERFAHSERNISLLLPEFEKNPWDMHNRVQLVQEYLFMEEYQEKALDLCEDTLKGDKKIYKTNEFQWILSAYIRLANKAADYVELIRRAEYVRKNYPLSATADLSISILEVNARYKTEQYTEGVAVLEHALERRRYLLENLEIKNKLMCMDFETYLEDDIYAELLRMGIRCCLKIQKDRRAKELSQERFRVLKSPVLSISVLVSNRKNTIRKCLESVQSLLMSVPSELIIVDTVGEEYSDGSLAIAKEYTEHIVPFVWCDDFAAARNAGLQEAKGEWFLYLDDDEWFEKTEELQHFFYSGEYLDYSSATYQVRNYIDVEGKQYKTEVVGRVVRRGKNTRFIGCVNETFAELFLPNKELSDYVHHYKYAKESAEEKEARLQYVYSLMLKELEKNPDNFRNRVQATAVLLGKNPPEARKVCLDTLMLCKEKKETEQYQWQIAVLFSLQESLQISGEEAEEVYHWLKEKVLMSIEAEQLACYRMTRIWIMKGQYVKAYSYAKKYFELGNEIESRIEELSKEFKKYQIPEYYAEMSKLGAFCAWQSKQYGDAWMLYEAMSWETADASAEDTLWKLFALAEEYVDEAALFRIIKRLMANEKIKPVLGKLMQNPQVKNRIQAVLAAQRTTNSAMGNEAKQKKIKLTISLLVSNRKDSIRKCMESLRPILEKVSSELIVVDTVGKEHSDGSLAIAKEYTNNIVHFDWCNDFAAARNAGLQQAKGEWFMFLDDDEWFEDVGELIEFFNSEEEKNYNSATYGIRNYKDSEGKNYSTAILGRIVRKTENLRFIGAIHESFSEFRLPCKAFASYVHHYGYVYVNAEEKKRHIQRNLELLQEEVKKEPKNLRYRAQMAMELATFDNSAALQFCEESILACEEKKSSPEFQWILSLIFRLYEALGTKAEKAEESYYKFKQQYGFSETAENAISSQMTRIHLLQEDYEAAFPYAESYIATAAYLSENKEVAQLQMSADFARYREEEYYLEMLHFAAFCAWKAKKYDMAWAYYQNMPWENPKYQNEEDLWKIFAMSEESENDSVLLDIILRLKKNKSAGDVLGTLLQNQEVKEKINKLLLQENGNSVEQKILSQNTEKILVTVSLMVSNRKDTIRKCMESIKPLLEMVPSELIAVDTVGEENSDGSLAIVKEYTDKIVHFDWCNDFSAARNAGLQRARGEWFLFLDDDEWFENITPIILFFLEGDYKNYDRGWYVVRNYSDFTGKKYDDNVVDRMCKITQETKFVGRIHECLKPDPKKIMKFQCYVHHYGYAYKGEEDRLKHTERNLSLLREELKENPYDLRMNGQLVQELCVAGDFEEAEQVCEYFFERNLTATNDMFVQYLAVMLVKIKARQGQKEAALVNYKTIRNRFQLLELPNLVCLTECLSVMGEEENAERMHLIREWLRQRDQIRNKAEQMQGQEIFDFRSYLSPDYEKNVLFCGIQAALKGEAYEILAMFLNRIDWSNEEKKPFEEMMHLFDAYGKSGRGELFFPYAEQIINNPQMKKPFFVALQGLIHSYPQRKDEISAWLDKQKGMEQKKQLTPEIEELIEQVMQNIKILMAAGQMDEAKELIQAVKEIVSEYDDVVNLVDNM